MARTTTRYLGRGIYSLADASRLTRLPARRIRRWVEGYDFNQGGRVHHSGPVMRSDFGRVDGSLALSFADLVELGFLNEFRKLGVSWPAIRVTSEQASLLLGRDHPFSSRQFLTDGRTILTNIARESEEPELLDLVKSQMAFQAVLQSYLKHAFEWSADDRVAKWWHEAGHGRVVLDPARAFGAPILSVERVPTRVIFRAFKIEGSLEAAARMFEVPRASAKAAIEFEQRLAA